MAVYALVSAGGSPGVTTTALALALTWPGRIILAECDPACGDILAGLYAGHLSAPRGLLGVAFEAGRGGTAVAAELDRQVAPLDGTGQRMFLAGLSDPRQAPGLAPAWPAVGRAMACHVADVIADCGRLDASDAQPFGVLTEASAVVLVLRPTLRQVARARPRIEMLAQLLGGTERIGLIVVAEGGYSPKEIASTLGVRVLASLPRDQKTAAVLSDGEGRRHGLAERPLMRAARAAGEALASAPAPASYSDLAGVRAGSAP